MNTQSVITRRKKNKCIRLFRKLRILYRYLQLRVSHHGVRLVRIEFHSYTLSQKEKVTLFENIVRLWSEGYQVQLKPMNMQTKDGQLGYLKFYRGERLEYQKELKTLKGDFSTKFPFFLTSPFGCLIIP
ncbi:MAG: hypothetical protein LBO06_02490 [Bacteroidales bacterium]|nr:hypothetical protein [Bacteroidales bacterium]